MGTEAIHEVFENRDLNEFTQFCAIFDNLQKQSRRDSGDIVTQTEALDTLDLIRDNKPEYYDRLLRVRRFAGSVISIS